MRKDSSAAQGGLTSTTQNKNKNIMHLPNEKTRVENYLVHFTLKSNVVS